MKQLIFDGFFRVLRLHILYLKISFRYLLAYKASALLTVFFSTVFFVAEVLTVNVYYRFIDHIGDWDQSSFYLLIGSFNLMVCLYTYLFEIAHDEFAFKIRHGDLDFDLIRPFDSQLFTSLDRVDFASLFNLPIPIWLIFTGFNGLNKEINLLDLALYVAVMGIGVFIIYLINQCAVNFAFWFTETSSLTSASNQIVQLGSKPSQVYPKVIQVGFSYIVPIILCTNISVKILSHDHYANDLLILSAVSTLFYYLVRIQWRLGLKRYSSASS